MEYVSSSASCGCMVVSSGMMLCPEHEVRIRDFSGVMKQPHSWPSSLRWSGKNLMSLRQANLVSGRSSYYCRATT